MNGRSAAISFLILNIGSNFSLNGSSFITINSSDYGFLRSSSRLLSEIPIAFSPFHYGSSVAPASHDSAILIVLSLPSSPRLARFQRWRHFGIRLPMVTSIVFHGLIFLLVSLPYPSLDVDDGGGTRARFRIARFKKLSLPPNLYEWKEGRRKEGGRRKSTPPSKTIRTVEAVRSRLSSIL